MARPEQHGTPRSQDYPVLVFEGARGSGKTALLAWMVTLLDQRVPYGQIDFEKSRHTATSEVLSALAFELSKRCRRYGVLRFPRFTVGQLVMHQDLDLDSQFRARQQVRSALEKERNIGTMRQILEETAGDALAGVGVPLSDVAKRVPKLVLDVVLDRLTKWAPGRRLVLGSFHDWYGHQGRNRTNDALDTLVDLNRWARNSDDEDSRQRIDQLLWDAFLADLCDQFTSSRRAGELSLNCVILLDNVDTRLGQMFVNGLVQARRQRAVMDDDTPDPLTVVVTSRGELADVPAEKVELTAAKGEVRCRARHEGVTTRWWCRYRLADLTQDEIGSMVSALALREGNNQRLTRMAHQLTDGHPASTRLLLDAVVERSEHRDAPSRVLDQLEPATQSARMTVVERMQRRLLGQFPEEVLDDLVTCAGARERQHAVRLATSSALLTCSQATYMAIIDPVLWPATAGAGPLLLRRLLLRTLARRDGVGSRNWSEIFDWHRAHCAASGDQTGELYYALATGDLAFVTQRLHERLVFDEATSWLELLTTVTTAPRWPRRPGDVSAIPIDQMCTLVRQVDLPSPLVPLTRLIACRWITDDPFSGSRLRGLHLQIAADYTALAGESPCGAEQLLFAAQNHHREAELWT